ncbi:MAG: AAA family ATPase [Acidimicrobiales bacterium]|nr:AAA family ATPase [Acidimicrobiales bacterium]
MPLNRVRIAGYRSLTEVTVDLAGVTVVVGPNGSGKTNLYRAMHLVHACAEGDLARAVVAEGGLASIVHAGWRKGEPRVELEVRLGDLCHDVTLATAGRGQLELEGPVFPLDPVVTHEHVVLDTGATRVELLDRAGNTAFATDQQGGRVTMPATLVGSESALSQLVDAHHFPELVEVRETLRRMRFHHQVRTDPDAPARRPGLATRTLAVADDGADLPAALLTILRMGDGHTLRRSIAEAFGGSDLLLDADESGPVHLALKVPGLYRPLSVMELSDGQLRFLFLAAALLAPRPPTVMVLNEPETSLHPDLLPALAELITAASATTQIVVTTHSAGLADRLHGGRETAGYSLEMVNGETRFLAR